MERTNHHADRTEALRANVEALTRILRITGSEEAYMDLDSACLRLSRHLARIRRPVSLMQPQMALVRRRA